MDADVLERARRRLLGPRDRVDQAELAAALERARAGVESLAETTASLETSVPERLSSALQEAMRAEALPVARSIAEVRGLSGQIVRRLERLQGDLDAERTARVEDLALLVDLVSTGWKAVERRLDRLERTLDRLERALDDQPADAAPLLRLDERRPGA